ncbi:MAG: carboxypeptidase-like regulatory domain-containing protein, partial [Candidatus Latescibacterota bacterium]
MFRGEKKGLTAAILAVALICILQTSLLAQTGTISGEIRNAADNSPLAYANVIILGTNLGAMSLNDGKFTIQGVPAGRYTIKAMMMGYKAEEKPGVVVTAGKDTPLDFKLEQTIVMKTQEIVVTAEKKMVEVTTSDARASVSSQQLE